MFRRGSLIRQRFAQALTYAAEAAAAGGAALTYLLRAPFSGSDSGAIANGTSVDTASAGSVTEGNLTVVDTSTGQVEVLSGALKITPTGTLTETGVGSTTALTRAAGAVLKATINQSSNTTTGTSIQLGTTSGSIASSNFVVYAGNVNGSATLRVFNPAGTQVGEYITSTAFTAGAARKVAIVTGGFDSSGLPASDVYGTYAFYYDGTNWVLIAADSRINTATLYPGVVSYSTTGATTQVDDFVWPDATVSVFEPTGYALDFFTGTNGTDIKTGHTADAGFDWSTAWYNAGGGTSEIQNNAARAKTSGTTNVTATDIGLSDLFITATVTLASVSTNSQAGIIYRGSDTDNYFLFQATGAGFSPDHFLSERVTGVSTTRASTDLGKTGTYKIQVRASGTVHECWADGVSEITYTTAVNQSLTSVGFLSRLSGSDFGAVSDLHVLPLTSATYDDATTGLESF